MAKQPGSGGGSCGGPGGGGSVGGGGGSTSKVLPELTVNDVTGNEGSSTTFTVTLDVTSTKNITVNYATANDATANGTALAGSDYTALSGTLTFLPGETTKTIAIATGDDLTYEPNETFLVNLTSPTNATIKDGQGVATLIDNDPQYQSVLLSPLYDWRTIVTQGISVSDPKAPLTTDDWSGLGYVEAMNYRYYSGLGLEENYTQDFTTHIGYQLPANIRDATLSFGEITTGEGFGPQDGNVTLNIYAYADNGSFAVGDLDAARTLVGTKSIPVGGPAFEINLDETLLNGLNTSGGPIGLTVDVMDLQPEGTTHYDRFFANSFHLDVLV